MSRPTLTVKTGKVAGAPAVVVIPADNPANVKFMGITELVDQAKDLNDVLTESNYHMQAVVIERLLNLLEANKLFALAKDVADELEQSGEIESALLIDTVVAVLRQELNIA